MYVLEKPLCPNSTGNAVKRANKASRIMNILEDLYPTTPIPLDHTDPFTLLVAVVLSAQTTDKKVNEVTPALFARAGTVHKMAALEIAEIAEFIRQIGLAPQKSKSLQGLSQKIISDFDGEVPRDMESLQSLPGVGRKTANVLMAQAFGVPAFPVDTHIHRLSARWGLSRAKTANGTEKDLTRIFPRDSWNKLHLQIIFFGREHCPALYHDLSACPICSWAASQTRKTGEAKANLALRSRGKSRARRPTSA
jgi:endonuclease-3